MVANGRESWVIYQVSDGLQTNAFASNCKEITGFPRRNVRPIIRLRKPMLYPLNYEGGTSARTSADSSARNMTLSLEQKKSTKLSNQVAR
jgi:hypothetical protein